MAAINVLGARRSVERLFSDRCLITRDSEFTADDVLDPVTLELVPGVDDSKVVYNGRCFMTRGTAQSQFGRPKTNALGQYEVGNAITVAIPWNAKDIRIGDQLSVTASVDVTLKGKLMIVETVLRSSVLVWRQFQVSMRETQYG